MNSYESEYSEELKELEDSEELGESDESEENHLDSCIGFDDLEDGYKKLRKLCQEKSAEADS